MSEQSLQAILEKAHKGEVKYIALLMSIGREKGFQSFINRKLIWPFLLGLDSRQFSSSIYEWDGEMDRNSQDYEQLQKDAQRSLASMKTFDSITKFHLQKRQQDVLKILDSFFARNQELRYIQGFHDIASIFIVLFGNSSGYYMMEKSGSTYFRDFLTKDIGVLSLQLSELVWALLLKKDPGFQHIFQCFNETRVLIFIIPWVLTWFSHVFSSVKTICRIWDYLLSTGPQGIIYLTAGVILTTKDELVNSNPEIDQATIHTFYQQKVKSESIDIEKAIKEAIELQKDTAIQSLPYYKNLDPASVLINQNFQLKIDLHRQVREYLKQEEKKSFKKKVVTGTAVLGLLVTAAGFYYLRHARKLGI